MDIHTQESLLALAAKSRKTAVIDVPGVGMLRVQELGAEAGIELEAVNAKMRAGEATTKDMMVMLLSSAIVDGVGRPAFTKEAAAQLVATSSGTMASSLVTAILEFLRPDSGNSKASPGEPSPSDSVSP